MDFSFSWEGLKALLNNNQFASGGLFIAAIGGILVYLRDIPFKIYAGIKWLLTYHVEVKQEDIAYVPISEYIIKALKTKSYSRTTIAETYNVDEDTDTSFDLYDYPPLPKNGAEDKSKKLLFSPGLGSHLVTLKTLDGKSFKSVVNRSRLQNPNMSEGRAGGPVAGRANTRATDIITISVMIWNREKLKTLLSSLNSSFVSSKKNIYLTQQDWLCKLKQVPDRNLDTIFLPKHIKDDVCKDMENFLSGKKAVPGLINKRCYLFHGIPGTGKTSLITALASKYNKNIIFVNDLEKKSSDDLRSIITNEARGHNSIIVFEDFDRSMSNVGNVTNTSEEEDVVDASAKALRTISSSFKEIANSTDKKELLGNILNILDGLMSREGQLIIITANDISQMDPALFRPGRISKKFYFDYMVETEIREMVTHFFKLFKRESEIEAFLTPIINNKKLTPAELQLMLMEKFEI